MTTDNVVSLLEKRRTKCTHSLHPPRETDDNSMRMAATVRAALGSTLGQLLSSHAAQDANHRGRSTPYEWAPFDPEMAILAPGTSLVGEASELCARDLCLAYPPALTRAHPVGTGYGTQEWWFERDSVVMHVYERFGGLHIGSQPGTPGETVAAFLAWLRGCCARARERVTTPAFDILELAVAEVHALQCENAELRGVDDCEAPLGPFAVLEWSTGLCDHEPRHSVAIAVETPRDRHVAFSAACKVLARIYPSGGVELSVVEGKGLKTLFSEQYDYARLGWYHGALYLIRDLHRAGSDPNELERTREWFLRNATDFEAWFDLDALAKESPRTRALLCEGLERFLCWWVALPNNRSWTSLRMLAHVRLLRAGIDDAWAEERDYDDTGH
jgi:hypothetical protein